MEPDEVVHVEFRRSGGGVGSDGVLEDRRGPNPIAQQTRILRAKEGVCGKSIGDLIVIAARPGMGKTAFVLSLAKNASVDFKKPVAFFSLEMSSAQLVQRLISSETGIPGDKLRKGNLDQAEWQ